ncbi:MAG: hypothetical protein EA359_14625 [Balneolaceae bacterium]|jgi:hypothetical protein|nr:MAG: hypothetical protein EA359_14625 [Balneolaceae bacterium]
MIKFMKKQLVLLLALPILFTGCYHAQITTGLQSSNEVYQQAWAHSFIGGLVPPNIVNAEQHCTNGVARVETRLSFLNMLAQFVTLSLYSPMEITVTCAASPRADLHPDSKTLEVPKNSETEIVLGAFNDAVKLSAESKQPVYVSFQ